jgi:limonene-1,2-epoxide hydrolase
MATPAETVTAFLAEWGKSHEAMLASYRDFLTPETVWENIGLSKTTGIAEAMALLSGFDQAYDMGLHTVAVDMLHIATAGNVVLTERIDRPLDGSGNELMALRIMGVFEVQDGKIARWRDYFDTSALPRPGDA